MSHTQVLLDQLTSALALDIQDVLNAEYRTMRNNLLAPLDDGETPVKAVLELDFHCEYNDSGYDMILQDSSEIAVLLKDGKRVNWRLNLNGVRELYTYRNGDTEWETHDWVYSLTNQVPLQQVSQALEMWDMLFNLTWNEDGTITVVYNGQTDYTVNKLTDFLGEVTSETRDTFTDDDDNE